MASEINPFEGVPYVPKGLKPVIKYVPHDDCNYATYFWTKERKPEDYKGRVLFVHGYRDTQPGYYYLFEQLVNHGWDVLYYDQRAEGHTVFLHKGEKGTTSEKYAYVSVDFFVDYNIREMESLAKAGTIPSAGKLSLLGCSMGGGLTLNYIVIGKNRKKVTAVVEDAPLIKMNKASGPSGAQELALKTLSYIPWCQNMRVKTPLNSRYITGDAKFQKYLDKRSRDTPLSCTIVEANDNVVRGKRLLKPEFYQRIDKNLPILICHGESDGINDFDTSKEFTRKLNAIPGQKNKKFIAYPGGHHELFMEVPEIRDKFIQDVEDFLSEYASI